MAFTFSPETSKVYMSSVYACKRINPCSNKSSTGDTKFDIFSFQETGIKSLLLLGDLEKRLITSAISLTDCPYH